jgi:2-keto-4-pentenoate hydratase
MAPITDSSPALGLGEAYGIQLLNVARRLAAGERIVGHKIGLTARAMQELFKVHEPDYGHLFGSMIHDPARPLDLDTLIEPQVEVEPAFVLRKRLMGPSITTEDVLDATDHVVTCLEVIDSRIVDWRIRLQDTVADNGSSARVVLGTQYIRPRELALDTLDATLELDGVVVESGNTREILGHPANGVAWLANSLAAFGIALEAGHIVLPGTCTRSRRLTGPGRACGRIAGLGPVTLELAGRPVGHRTP